MTFQQLMDYLLCGLPHASVYLNDILIASSSVVEHCCLCQVFSLLEQRGCISGHNSIEFLRHQPSVFPGVGHR